MYVQPLKCYRFCKPGRMNEPLFRFERDTYPAHEKDWLDGTNKGTPRLFAPAGGAGATRWTSVRNLGGGLLAQFDLTRAQSYIQQKVALVLQRHRDKHAVPESSTGQGDCFAEAWIGLRGQGDEGVVAITL
jgi:hypothetical protein